MRMSSLTPSAKVTAAGLAGIIASALIWALINLFHVDLTADVSAAIVTLVTFIVGYFKKPSGSDVGKLAVLLLLLLPITAQAQTIPNKLLELDTVQAPGASGTESWTQATDRTVLYVSGTDSARVYFASSAEGRVVLARVSGRSYVRAGVFGWFQVTQDVVVAYNAFESVDRASLDYPLANSVAWMNQNYPPLDLALIVGYAFDGPNALRMVPGAVIPQALR